MEELRMQYMHLHALDWYEARSRAGMWFPNSNLCDSYLMGPTQMLSNLTSTTVLLLFFTQNIMIYYSNRIT